MASIYSLCHQLTYDIVPSYFPASGPHYVTTRNISCGGTWNILQQAPPGFTQQNRSLPSLMDDEEDLYDVSEEELESLRREHREQARNQHQDKDG